MADSDITVEILKDIRDELRGVRSEFREELRGVRTELRDEIRGLREDTNQRLEANTQRLDLVETTLLDLAEQQRFVVRYTKAISERGTSLEPRVSALESARRKARVEVIGQAGAAWLCTQASPDWRAAEHGGNGSPTNNVDCACADSASAR